MWSPISDLPADWQRIASKDIQSLQPLWKQQASRLKDSQSFRDFNDRLARHWAIETGYIERLYTLDQGITETLIEYGIEASRIPHNSTDTPPEKLVPILLDQKEALDGLFDFVRADRSLSISYIRELHQLFTRHQDAVEAATPSGELVKVPLQKGVFKTLPNNPKRKDGSTHCYCPPEQVDSEMENLIRMHAEHEAAGVPPDVEAAWLHHRFTQIHPFQDGNGRIARALASLIFIKAGWFPVVIRRDQRDNYISCLEKADEGSLESLAKLFASIQKLAFIQALSLSQTVLKEAQPVSDLIKSGIDRLRTRFEEKAQNLARVFEFSSELEEICLARFGNVAGELQSQLVEFDSNYEAAAFSSRESNHHFYHTQILDLAREFEYYADTRSYRRWVRLKILEENQCDLIVSFHSIGHEFIGIMAAVAFLEFRERRENAYSRPDGPHRLNTELFQFSYNADIDDLSDRFREWLEESVLTGLDFWRQRL